MSTIPPRVVVVSRPSEYEALIARHATHAQAAFFLSNRNQDIEVVRDRHEKQEKALHAVGTAVPLSWRSASVLRNDLDRFVFEPEDIVVIVGQDGLVANTSKYLSEHPIIGINPDFELNDGILVPFRPDDAAELIQSVAANQASLQLRTMVNALLDDGQSLTALNEIFVGVRSHQSARYRIRFNGTEERQSSSGIIISTGTGATGWTRSIALQRNAQPQLPKPEDHALVFFVREAFPSISTGTSLAEGVLDGNKELQITSENNTGGVIFGDGIETDYLTFDWGQEVRISTSQHACCMVTG